MRRKGSGLAARFRRAFASEDEARRRSEQEQQARALAARAARSELFQDLAAFAEETGFVRAQLEDEGVTLRYLERFLHFAAKGPADEVSVEFEGAPDEQHAVYREAQLGDRWVWVARKRGREDRQPLFDTGLEQLLVRALGLPKPTDAEETEDAGSKRQL